MSGAFSLIDYFFILCKKNKKCTQHNTNTYTAQGWNSDKVVRNFKGESILNCQIKVEKVSVRYCSLLTLYFAILTFYFIHTAAEV